MTDQPMKECPDCKAEVRADAKVCRYCQYRFGGDRNRLIGGIITIVAIAAVVAVMDGAHEVRPVAHAAPIAASPLLLGKNDPSLPPLVRKVYALEDGCRGGIGVTPDSPICRQRDEAVDQLQKQHWCYGEPGQTDADSVWHECIARETTPISKQHLDWIRGCQDAIRTDLNDPRSADFPSPDVDADAFAHIQADQLNGPANGGPDTAQAWLDKHPDQTSEIITFKFHAKNVMGGVQRYTAFCTFADNFDGTTKLVRHAAGAD